MQKQTIKSKQEGFTIIEVLIVLAIAALILLVVFLAVPGLQRSQANSAAKADATNIAAGVTTYLSNNNGTLPNSKTEVDKISADINSASLSKFKNTNTTALTMATTNTFATAGTAAIVGSSNWNYFDGAGTTPVAPTTQGWYFIVDTNASCPATGYAATGGSLATTATTGKVALLYTTQTGAGSAWNCIQSN